MLQLANLIMDCLKVYIFTYLKKQKNKNTSIHIRKFKKKEPLRRYATSKFTLCPYLQPTASPHSFLNSGKIICTLIHMNPLGCLLTSQKLLSTTLCRHLVMNDLVQLPKESVITPLYLPSATDGLKLSGGTRGKEPACQCRRPKRRRFDPWVRKIPWRKAWKPAPVFLPGESHGQRNLAGYIAHSIAKSQTRLKQLSMYRHRH